MTEQEYQEYKNKAIAKDVLSVENRIRHAFNQGVECGRKMVYPQVEGITPTVVKPQENDFLDKIRAEIEEPLKINKGMHTDSAKAQAIALSWCLEIIDKYKAESEEKNDKGRSY